jgi:hypothetical protein
MKATGEQLKVTDNSRDDPQHWRDQAKQARALADKMKDAESRRMMIGIAEGYDNLACPARRPKSFPRAIAHENE